MDTSETRIKMCKKAEEIQELAPKMEPWFSYNNVTVDSRGEFNAFPQNWPEDSFIWLPRQDELQEMLGDKWSVPWLPRNIWDFYRTQFYPHSVYEREGLYPSTWEPDSMEQLWLAFVMKEKYGKVWNGEDWIKEDS